VGPEFEVGCYQISQARNEAEKREAYRLRFEVFSDEGFIDPEYFPDGELRDRFDSVSTQILVRDRSGRLAATTRFVQPSPLGFPTEALFDFEPPPIERERLGEYGRLAIKDGHRGGSRAPMLGMLKAVFECMLTCGTTHVFAFLTPALARSYAALGCVSERLAERPLTVATRAARAPMRGYFDTQEVKPVLFDLREMMVEVGVPIDRAAALFSQENDLDPPSAEVAAAAGPASSSGRVAVTGRE
jgi:N-acyl-L-homoserine lactone synthetase